MWAVAPGPPSGATEPHGRVFLGGVFLAEAENSLWDTLPPPCPSVPGEGVAGAEGSVEAPLELTRG